MSIIADKASNNKTFSPNAGSLGKTCELGNPPPTALRRERFRLQRLAGELLPEERVRGCLVWWSGMGEGVAIESNGANAHYSNLQTCGSVWSCPVCSAKINLERRNELKRAMEQAAKMGYGVYLVTFTLQHNRGDNLDDLTDALKDAYRRLKRGAPWGRIVERFGIVGHITATEGTHGDKGWHPHLHCVVFTAKPLFERRDDLQTVLAARFAAMVDKVGRYASIYHAVDVRGGQAAGDYLTKFGLEYELTNHETKRGHGDSPFQLLAKYGDGDQRAGDLFREWALTMKGKRQLVWSNGLRELLQLGAEQDNEAIATAQEKDAVPVMVLDFEQWREVCRWRLRAFLLEVVEESGVSAAWSVLSDLGQPQSELNARMLERAIAAPEVKATIERMYRERGKLEITINLTRALPVRRETLHPEEVCGETETQNQRRD